MTGTPKKAVIDGLSVSSARVISESGISARVPLIGGDDGILSKMTSILETKNFAAAVLDALASQLCVVDREGVIVVVNRAWINFKKENSPTPPPSDIGAHYLGICLSARGLRSDEAAPFATGLQSVLAGSADLFELEYPCHSPTQDRWFLGRVTPLGIDRGGAVISHLNVTKRKLMELELARLADTDPLTGSANRRSFREAANEQVDRVRRNVGSASIIMLDVDHFKVLNDTYGHAVGDQALRWLAEILRRSIRQMDVLARHGGEEFVILLPGTGETDGWKVAEKLRLLINGEPLHCGGQNIALTASFGVAEILLTDLDIDDGIARADIALYAAKHDGRNCVKRYAALPAERHRLKP